MNGARTQDPCQGQGTKAFSGDGPVTETPRFREGANLPPHCSEGGSQAQFHFRAGPLVGTATRIDPSHPRPPEQPGKPLTAGDSPAADPRSTRVPGAGLRCPHPTSWTKQAQKSSGGSQAGLDAGHWLEGQGVSPVGPLWGMRPWDHRSRCRRGGETRNWGGGAAWRKPWGQTGVPTVERPLQGQWKELG